MNVKLPSQVNEGQLTRASTVDSWYFRVVVQLSEYNVPTETEVGYEAQGHAKILEMDASTRLVF